MGERFDAHAQNEFSEALTRSSFHMPNVIAHGTSEAMWQYYADSGINPGADCFIYARDRCESLPATVERCNELGSALVLTTIDAFSSLEHLDTFAVIAPREQLEEAGDEGQRELLTLSLAATAVELFRSGRRGHEHMFALDDDMTWLTPSPSIPYKAETCMCGAWH